MNHIGGSQTYFSSKVLVAGIFLLALILRISHNDAIMQSPLYDHPVGGHTPYFALAEEISDGNIFTKAPLYTLSSPGYPYFVAAIYKLSGVHQFFALRMFTAFLDSLSAVFLFFLVRRFYSVRMSLGVSFIYAVLSPVVFYSVELTPIPLTSFLLIVSFFLWTFEESRLRRCLAMFVLGLSCTMRPNLVLIFPLLLGVSYFKEYRRNVLQYVGYFCVGMLGVLPITYANFIHSGEFILLSTSGGHNLYIGHNEGSDAGYNLPEDLDGDISENMKKRAESAVGHDLSFSEASTFFTKTALRNIMEYPARELSLLYQKSYAFFNAYEATNYVDFYFQKRLSPVLRYLPDFGFFLAFLVFGTIALVKERDFLFLIPIAVCFVSVVLFFFISRLRMPCAGFIAVVSCYGMVKWRDWFRGGGLRFRILLVVSTSLLLYITMNINHVIDTSNEQNKEALVWQYLEEYEKAENAFKEAIATNPENVQPYQNLMVLYNKLGREQDSESTKLKVNKILETQGRPTMP